MTYQEIQLSCCCCSGLSVSFTFQMAASAVTQMTSLFNCIRERKGEECVSLQVPPSLQGMVRAFWRGNTGILKHCGFESCMFSLINIFILTSKSFSSISPCWYSLHFPVCVIIWVRQVHWRQSRTPPAAAYPASIVCLYHTHMAGL